MSQKMVMDKEFFRREIVLWGEPNSLRSVASDTAHRFHFSFTMPYVNMPTPRQTADVEISYSLMANLFTDSLNDLHKTSSRCFHFEPVIQQRISHGAAAAGPLESIVALKDASAGTSSSQPGAGGKTHLSLHVFHPTPAYLPGELVELLILAPAGKKIVNAAFQLRENVRCRKSSAPIIDESDVPLLWQYSVDLTPPQEISFSKLSKSSVAQDIGMLGRYMFTSEAAAATALPNALAMQKALPPLPPASSPSEALSPRNTIDASASSVYRRRSGKGQSSSETQRASVPLSPLAESQELLGSANSSSQTLATVPGSALATDTSHPPQATAPTGRGRTGSLGIHPPNPATAQLFQQSY
ncbi:hypothetical protein GGI21_006232, partial [Coemansia aciculifera]